MSVFRLVSGTVRLFTLVCYSINPLFKRYRMSGLSLGIFGIFCYFLGRRHQQSFPESLFNLTESERQQVWKGYLDAEMRAAKEALNAFPLLSPISENDEALFREQDQNRQALRLQLKEKYTRAVLDDHSLSQAQFSEIEVEARLKRWNAPIEVV